MKWCQGKPRKQFSGNDFGRSLHSDNINCDAKFDGDDPSMVFAIPPKARPMQSLQVHPSLRHSRNMFTSS